MSMHAQSMPDEMCVAAAAPLQTSSEFVEAVAQLLQKRKVRVARHLQVRVVTCNFRARHAKEWDELHVEHCMSQTSVAQSVEHDKLRSVALAASGKDALCVLMQATPMELDSGPKTLQTFVDALWQYQLRQVGVLSVYVVHGLIRVAFLGWRVPLGPSKPWYWEHIPLSTTRRTESMFFVRQK